ncbi:hypothetical protein [Sporosarcina highlanderae]|uniref:Uncharacterized protein n=1 Tax=Sporosarcina highlanderae TaxID=3035916 RepID=A0ABT8JT63_9BACL|nr:hypothetical protein [Sporosarcina highlanderae]MDN4608187.1 hypothetical protein [Sporosarcina highlanderae]
MHKTIVREVAAMKPGTKSLTKDVKWTIDEKAYVVKNVPYSILPAEENEYFDMDVSIRLTMIRDLMYMNEIPAVIDYSVVSDFEV